jgi:pimeloyl-ACP methyl ester carboxylesterase
LNHSPEEVDSSEVQTAMSEEFITTPDGVRLFVQKDGGGSNAVVIPNAAYMFEDFRYLASGRQVVSFDLRNRGRSDAVTDPTRLKRGIHHDVEDLEAVRRHAGMDKVDVIGHSYVGMVVALYALKYPEHVNRVVMIGAVQPDPKKQYPAYLTGADQTMAEVFAKLAEIQKEGPGADPALFGEKVWSIMKVLYVTNPDDADKITWSVFHLPNETFSNVMKHYNENLLPSMHGLNLNSEHFAKMQMPVLVVHGTRDRNAPYGGGREWALLLPNARLITVEGGAHVPWIESPRVFDSIRRFLDGEWPEDAVKTTTLEEA